MTTGRVRTWTDHPCGCSSSDAGDVVLSESCKEHARLLERAIARGLAGPRPRVLSQYGPFELAELRPRVDEVWAE